MKRILFVDDEPNVLEGLQRMLYPLQNEWKMAFASSGSRALETLEQSRFDVVVSDMRMPGMDGAQLLAEVKKRYPDILRFVLSGQSATDLVYRAVGDAHQFLSKPCKPKLLKECVDKAFALRELLASDSLKAVVARIRSLPPVPHVYAKLCEALKSSEYSIADVGRVIEMDLAMTAKILQVANSAFFGLRRQVATATQAASLLGLNTINALVLTTGLFAPIEGSKLPRGFSINALWEHSMIVGWYARSVCLAENTSSELAGDAYTAGLLHDTGKLVLASAYTEEYAHVYDHSVVNAIPLHDAEKQVLGCTHAEVGAYLLGIWGLPHAIIESVAYHHRPADSVGTSFAPLTAVHAADVLAFGLQKEPADYPAPAMDMAYLGRLGLEGRAVAWEGACANIDVRGGG
ncbi:MAG: HDOD domain-containing protein [Candidatus Hydrogenedentes bacterium]|nr:HDOD domain-containing protein [Candidatus Hydrogenedentota bacterium]